MQNKLKQLVHASTRMSIGTRTRAENSEQRPTEKIGPITIQNNTAHNTAQINYNIPITKSANIIIVIVLHK